MNAVEIEEAISALAAQPFDGEGFPYGKPGKLQSAFTEDSHSSLTARLLKSQK